MADPLSLLPFALAAAGGAIDGVECRQLVAAGLALRPRSALVTQTLTRGAASIALPPGPAYLTALAACDGFPVCLLDPFAPDLARARFDATETTGVVFTLEALAEHFPAAWVLVLLDATPASALVRQHGVEKHVDLGAHFGLDLAGERDVEGHAEVCLQTQEADGSIRSWTHRELLHAIRAEAATRGETPLHTHRAAPSWHRADALVAAAATLYVGGHVRTDA